MQITGVLRKQWRIIKQKLILLFIKAMVISSRHRTCFSHRWIYSSL